MIHACYLTVFEKPQEELERALYDLFNDLGAVYDEYESVPLNPLSGQYELQAAVTENFEFLLNVHWPSDINFHILITFDIEMAVPVELVELEKILAQAAETYFPKLILVYNSYGDQRSERLFPLVMNFENAVREFIISVMLKKYGSNWENTLDKYIEDAEQNIGKYKTKYGYKWEDKLRRYEKCKNDAVKSKEDEAKYQKHNPLLMHWLYHANFTDLSEMISMVDDLEGGHKLARSPQSTFASTVDKSTRDIITSKINQVRVLRNRLMHGRYLTGDNEELIKSICEEFHDLIIQPGHINNFESRRLSED
ncbi:hypothetical protein [Nodularia sp. NIES-3585]|uniref:hypothetical protein n=1 Tax=Nodularia sp. NIES-3585 TaxID=1973477 RepID=UPI000B5C54AD|nr:hypothetical protein [Nodularia sp. NIES-3585]GAX38021.1 hypothetical protein NIES3585_40680 [Nodularia sp. NIES-3585]